MDNSTLLPFVCASYERRNLTTPGPGATTPSNSIDPFNLKFNYDDYSRFTSLSCLEKSLSSKNKNLDKPVLILGKYCAGNMGYKEDMRFCYEVQKFIAGSL